MRDLLRRYLRHRFAWLFCSLLLTIGVSPVLEALLPFNPLELFLAVNLVAAIASAAHERWIRALVVLGVASLLVRGLAVALGVAALQPISQLAWLLTTLLAVAATARHAVRAGTVDTEHLFAALDTYLLVGLLFGVGYSVLDLVAPASFGSPVESDLSLTRGVYFSFVTLATLGYGDIVPASGIAKGIAILEAVAGQLYLAVLVARLVTLYGRERTRG
jgi:hypothetical protein